MKSYAKKSNAVRAAITSGIAAGNVEIITVEGGFQYRDRSVTVETNETNVTPATVELAGTVETDPNPIPFSALISTDAELAAAASAAKTRKTTKRSAGPTLTDTLNAAFGKKTGKPAKAGKTAKAKKPAKPAKTPKTPAVAGAKRGRMPSPVAVEKFMGLVTREGGATFADIFAAVGDKPRKWLFGTAAANGHTLEHVRDGRAAGVYIAKPVKK